MKICLLVLVGFLLAGCSPPPIYEIHAVQHTPAGELRWIVLNRFTGTTRFCIGNEGGSDCWESKIKGPAAEVEFAPEASPSSQ
jgi:hypothetical protein